MHVVRFIEYNYNLCCREGCRKSPRPTKPRNTRVRHNTANRRGPNSVLARIGHGARSGGPRSEFLRRPRLVPPVQCTSPRKATENGTVKNNNDGKKQTESLEGKCIVLQRRGDALAAVT